MTGTHYQFLPYARTALASSATSSDDGRLTAHVQVQVGRTLMAAPAPVDSPVDPVDVSIRLYGARDSLGLEPSQVIRTQPRQDDWDVEPNYLASIELDSPELPWLLTPRLPEVGRLAPWIVLVVVPLVPGRPDPVGSAAGCTLPVLRADVSDLPDLTESWAWAHVQLLTDEIDPAALQRFMQDPSKDPFTLSRLLSPRRLEPTSSYVAVVVPAFAAGVAAAGLDVPVGAPDAPAWGATSPSPVVLPVYHQWRFRTGRPGDFESMARLLHPVDALSVPGLGRRSMAVDPAEVPGGEAATPFVLPLRSALTTFEVDPPRPAEAAVVEAGLEAVVNAAAVLEAQGVPDPVGPPVYGEWLAERSTVDRTVAEPRSWLDGLNVDPVPRVAAAAGGDVVRADQEQLMAAAWDQVKDVDRANEALRWLQLSLVATRRLATGRVEPRTATSAARLCASAAGTLPFAEAGAATVAQRLAVSPLPLAATDVAFSKVVTRAARRAQVSPSASLVGMSTRLLTDAATMAPPDAELVPAAFDKPERFKGVLAEIGGLDRMVATSQTTVAQAFDAIADLPSLMSAVQGPAVPQPGRPRKVRRLGHHGDEGVDVQEQVDLAARLAAAHLGEGQLEVQQLDVASHLAQQVHAEHQVDLAQQVLHAEPHVDLAQQVEVVGGGLLADAGGQVALEVSQGSRDWLLQVAVDIDPLRRAIELPAAGRESVSEFATRFAGTDVALATADSSSLLASRIGLRRSAVGVDLGLLPAATASGLTEAIAKVRDRIVLDTDSPAAAELHPLSAEALHAAVTAGVAPERTFGILAAARVQVDGSRVSRVLRRMLHPIMLAPDFPQPVSERLKRIAPDHLLANASRLEPDGITLLTTNPTFVEAVMVGLNHEMARELLYRGYPTDRMGTSFRRFWHRLDGSPDISRVTDWDAGPLGSHGAGGLGGNLVVVLRGDLLRRYPRTIVSARKGRVVHAPDGEAAFAEDAAEPPRAALFGGQIEPDISYVGLQLTAAEAADPGWFVLLEQPPTEPRFGLDVGRPSDPPVPQGWNDLTWSHAVTPHSQLGAAPSGLRSPHVPGGLAWGVDASRTAAILLQQPFRLALPTAHYLHGGH